MKITNPFKLLNGFEKALYAFSLAVIFLCCILSEKTDPVTVAALLIGATALIFVAKGEPTGQVLTVVFALVYSYISYGFGYYGEMITYLGMTSPIAVAAVVEWVRNPYERGRSEVKVNTLTKKQTAAMWILAVVVTVVFYFILRYFETPNIFFGTVSVTTSFVASYLTLFRSPFYAVGYAANDVVLMILWILAAVENTAYIPMIVCFFIFFINDSYGFFNWRRMKQRQSIGSQSADIPS